MTNNSIQTLDLGDIQISDICAAAIANVLSSTGHTPWLGILTCRGISLSNKKQHQ
jgi:hypothetical protein